MKYKITLYDTDVPEAVKWAINNCYSYIFHESRDVSAISKTFDTMTEFYFATADDAQLFVDNWKPDNVYRDR